MSTLDDVKSYMNFWGWTNSGGPGSEKLDADDVVVAVHGDAAWLADIEKACATLKRLQDRILAQPPGDKT